jgi:predicted permease
LEQASLDWRALVFALATSLIASLIFGVAPALRTPARSLLGGGLRATSRRAVGLRAVLVTVQIAVTVVLLTGAGLLLRSLWKLQSVPLGMETDHVVTARFVLGRQRYQQDAQQLAFFSELEHRAASLPGVTAAAITDSMPPSGGARGRARSVIEVEGRLPMPEGTGGMVTWRYVSPGYFAALRIPILQGRGFAAGDREPGMFSVVLSQILARKLFPGDDAVGKRMLKGPNGEWFTVIGVAGDVKNAGIGSDAAPEYYLVRKPLRDFVYAQQEPPTGWRAGSIILRSSLDANLLLREVRVMFAEIDPTLPIETETMRQRLDGIHARPRFRAMLLGAFAATGLVLASIGLFGVLSFLVGRRTREIGVRMALGATAPSIVRLILRDAARWTGIGLVLGVAGSFGLTRVLRTMLFQVEPNDPLTLTGALVMLCVVAATAAVTPALRASRLDPVETLRQE